MAGTNEVSKAGDISVANGSYECAAHLLNFGKDLPCARPGHTGRRLTENKTQATTSAESTEEAAFPKGRPRNPHAVSHSRANLCQFRQLGSLPHPDKVTSQ